MSKPIFQQKRTANRGRLQKEKTLVFTFTSLKLLIGLKPGLESTR